MNYIINRNGRPYCTTCMEDLTNVMEHLKHHGVGKANGANRWAGTNIALSQPRPLGDFIPARDLEAHDNPYKPTPEEIERDRKWGTQGYE